MFFDSNRMECITIGMEYGLLETRILWTRAACAMWVVRYISSNLACEYGNWIYWTMEFIEQYSIHPRHDMNLFGFQFQYSEKITRNVLSRLLMFLRCETKYVNSIETPTAINFIQNIFTKESFFNVCFCCMFILPHSYCTPYCRARMLSKWPWPYFERKKTYSNKWSIIMAVMLAMTTA